MVKIGLRLKWSISEVCLQIIVKGEGTLLPVKVGLGLHLQPANFMGGRHY